MKDLWSLDGLSSSLLFLVSFLRLQKQQHEEDSLLFLSLFLSVSMYTFSELSSWLPRLDFDSLLVLYGISSSSLVTLMSCSWILSLVTTASSSPLVDFTWRLSLRLLSLSSDVLSGQRCFQGYKTIWMFVSLRKESLAFFFFYESCDLLSCIKRVKKT